MEEFFGTIWRDVEFFTKHNIMDYSLLIIILKKPNSKWKESKHVSLNDSFSSDDENEDYTALLE